MRIWNTSAKSYPPVILADRDPTLPLVYVYDLPGQYFNWYMLENPIVLGKPEDRMDAYNAWLTFTEQASGQ